MLLAKQHLPVDQNRRTVTVNDFQDDSITVQYSFGAVIKVNICDDRFIDFRAIERLLQ